MGIFPLEVILPIGAIVAVVATSRTAIVEKQKTVVEAIVIAAAAATSCCPLLVPSVLELVIQFFIICNFNPKLSDGD